MLMGVSSFMNEESRHHLRYGVWTAGQCLKKYGVITAGNAYRWSIDHHHADGKNWEKVMSRLMPQNNPGYELLFLR